MSRTNSGPYVIRDSITHKFWNTGTRMTSDRGWKDKSKDATTFDRRGDAEAARRSILVYGAAARSRITVVPAPRPAIAANAVAQVNVSEMPT